MTSKHENIAEIIYLDSPISKAIMRSIGNSPTALSQVVSKTGFPREEVATCLLDMVTKGLISHSIELPNDKAEAVFSLSSKGGKLLNHERRLMLLALLGRRVNSARQALSPRM